MNTQAHDDRNGLEVAVIGMSCRFPGARDIHQFWENVKNGLDTISDFTDEQLEQAGVEREWIADPNYVKAKGIIGDAEMFDPSFFGYTPTEAALMDPQIRIFHECAWTALEDAGYDPKSYKRPIGLYAGASSNLDWKAKTILSDQQDMDDFSKSILSDKDLLAQLVAYKLHLTGPVNTVHAACATSLVSIHLACQALIGGECDIALAGGVSITTPETQGYFYYEHMHESPDGRNRAFDTQAQGTIFSNGAGIVVLKMLEDALADGDHIYAVVKGSALNNDGSRKTGFTAPSPKGQAEVIKAALKVAEVSSETISYVEAHGTATPVGDPIEIEALKLAYDSNKTGFCKIGSVKSNFGHLDAAAGIAGFIKTALSLKNKQIPPSLHYTASNPRIDFVHSPFQVNTELQPWKQENGPLRAGVSSFGIGGTNAHVILEEAPIESEEHEEVETNAAHETSKEHLIVLSARTESSLQQIEARLAEYLNENPDVDVANAAFTLQMGRRGFAYRSYVIGSRAGDIANTLRSGGSIRSDDSCKDKRSIMYILPRFDPSISYLNMGYDFYENEATFRTNMDECFGILQSLYGRDVKTLLYPESSGRQWTPVEQEAGILLYAAAFRASIAYSFAALLKDWGIHPQIMIGDEHGKAVWACLSGKMSLLETLQSVKEAEEPSTAVSVVDREFSFYAISDNGRFEENPQFSEAIVIHLDFSDRYPVGDEMRTWSDISLYTMRIVGECWRHGIEPNWANMHRNKHLKRVSLPGYCFDRQLYTIKDQSYQAFAQSYFRTTLSKQANIAQWLYAPAWESSLLFSSSAVGTDKGIWLIFSDEAGFGMEVAEQMKQAGYEVVTVQQGESYSQIKESRYCIRPDMYMDYVKLLESIVSGGKQVYKVVHMWSVSAVHQFPLHVDAVQRAQISGFYSLVHLANALREQLLGEITVDVVTNNTMQITSDERLHPEKALILGPCKVIPQEYPNVNCRYIDMELDGHEEIAFRHAKFTRQLCREITANSDDTVVAYRGNTRWLQSYKPIVSDEPKQEQIPLRQGGVYLITGGLGRVGYVLAKYLATAWNAKLVLTGSTPIPDKQNWEQWLQAHDEQDPISCKIRLIQELERAGAVVWACQAEAGNQEQMLVVVQEMENRFGTIHGVIHAAGARDDDSSGLLEQQNKPFCERQFSPKVYGLLVLEQVLRGKELDFCLLTSSLSSILGGLGHSSYSAANIFMDVFAQQMNRLIDVPWISVNWDSWAIFEQGHETGIGKEVMQLAMTPEEGIHVFKRALYRKEACQIIVSTADLKARMERWIQRSALRTDEDNQGTFVSLTGHMDNDEIFVSIEQVEHTLAQIWKNVLGVAAVSPTDNFFDLGGDSLKAVTILSLIFKKLRLKVPLAAFFNAATIRQLSQYVIGLKTASTEERIQPADRRDAYPLSAAQRRLFALEEVRDTGTSYNIPYAFILEGLLDISRFEQALTDLVMRHEPLRTSFEYRNGEPVQVVHEYVSFDIQYVDWKNEEVDLKRMSEQRIQQFVYPFELNTAPLFRVVLAHLSPTKYVLFIDMHHLITDGISIGLMTKEFMALYQGVDLPVLSIQYKDYAVWQSHHLRSEWNHKQRAYWMESFKGDIPVLQVPTDYERSAVQSPEGNSLQFSIDAETTARLRMLAKDTDASMFMIMITIFYVLLHKVSGQEDVVVGTVASGRSHEDMEQMLGVFINTLALRTFPKGHKSFIEYVQEVRKTVLTCFENQDYQFDQLVEDVCTQADAGRNLLFDMMFDWQNVPAKELEMDGIHITPYPFEHRISQFDVAFIGWETSDQVAFEVVYRTHLFREGTIRKFVAYFEEIAMQVVRNRGIALSDIVISHQFVAAQANRVDIEFDF
ncbi:condensation domain-containing protein [Paenibacillus arenosi]|uniref:KR domain-containing protein n=1 Tax=Paenibacillus arenosi TaxID=2774142 RepID=A0ABR9AS39_9BACL|nr:condensation domain-containing protein [Paenibacillus arenosi]MBD8496929.1 KR domain-containing protein [Paenibacillus arenosi]